jgi:hypothetical protein
MAFFPVRQKKCVYRNDSNLPGFRKEIPYPFTTLVFPGVDKKKYPGIYRDDTKKLSQLQRVI